MDFILPGSLFLFVLGGLIAVKVDLAKRPTWKESRKTFKETSLCDEIHRSINEKLDTLPGIQESVTRIETILKERNK